MSSLVILTIFLVLLLQNEMYQLLGKKCINEPVFPKQPIHGVTKS